MPIPFLFGGGGSASIINSAPGIVAQFDATTGITSSGGFASQWSDLSGNARHLLQATGANQPIHLDYVGTKFAVNFGVNGNGFSVGDSVANSPTGDLAIVLKIRLRDYTPTVANMLCAKATGAGFDPRSFSFYVAATTGNLVYSQSADGATWNRNNINSTAAPVISDNSDFWLAVSHDVDNGAAGNDIKFWTSADGATWAQLGTTITQAGVTAIADSNADLYWGAAPNLANPVNGRLYYGAIYKGIPPMLGGSGSATPSQVLDPTLWSGGGTWVGAGGETCTINSTGSKPAQIVDRPSLLFDGTAHFMKCSAFTLNQPETIYLVGRQITWTSTDVLLDGNAVNAAALAQTTGTPKVSINAGAAAAENADLTLATRKVVCAVINGASSSIQVGTAAATTGNAGAGNMGGFTLGAAGSNLLFGNLQVREILIYNVAHTAAQRAAVIAALMSKWGVA